MINLRGSRFTDIMPENMASQLETQAFAYALGRQIEKLCAYADGVHIYAAVASMPEKILDVLAVELQTPAYNQKFSIEVKRALIKGTLTFYARMGTPSACNQIIETIFGSGYIQEWFDYEGDPHHFRVTINVTGNVTGLEEIETLHRMIYTVKRLTSWLDETRFILEANAPAPLRLGGIMAPVVSLPLPEQGDRFDFLDSCRIGGKLTTYSVMPIGEMKEGSL